MFVRKFLNAIDYAECLCRTGLSRNRNSEEVLNISGSFKVTNEVRRLGKIIFGGCYPSPCCNFNDKTPLNLRSHGCLSHNVRLCRVLGNVTDMTTTSSDVRDPPGGLSGHANRRTCFKAAVLRNHTNMNTFLSLASNIPLQHPPFCASVKDKSNKLL